MLKRLIHIVFGGMLLPVAAARADINIAVIAPEEGEYALFGKEIISGAQIAVENINKNGGLKGEKINLIIADDRCNDNLAVSTAQMMAVNVSETDKIAMVVGPYCSNAVENVAEIYSKAGIFQIIPFMVNSRRIQEAPPGLVVLAGYKDSRGDDFFNYYNRSHAGKKVALIYDSNDRDIIDIAASVQQEFLNKGLQKELQIYSYASFDDADELVREVQKDEMSIAYVLGTPKEAAKISRMLKNENKEIVIYVNKYIAQEDFNRIMGNLADDVFYVGLSSLKNNPDFAATLVQLRLWGIEPEGLGIYGFSAVKLWEELVKQSDSFDYKKLAKTLSSKPVKTTWGEASFQNGAPVNAFNFGIYRHSDGQYTQVY